LDSPAFSSSKVESGKGLSSAATSNGAEGGRRTSRNHSEEESLLKREFAELRSHNFDQVVTVATGSLLQL
jgi:hypothetical protein